MNDPLAAWSSRFQVFSISTLKTTQSWAKKEKTIIHIYTWPEVTQNNYPFYYNLDSWSSHFVRDNIINILFRFHSSWLYEVGSISHPILQMKKLREVRYCQMLHRLNIRVGEHTKLLWLVWLQNLYSNHWKKPPEVQCHTF